MVNDIVDCIVQLGSGCLLLKRDLKPAYRQLPIDPFDYPLLGYLWCVRLFFAFDYPWVSGLLLWLVSEPQMQYVSCFPGLDARFLVIMTISWDLCTANCLRRLCVNWLITTGLKVKRVVSQGFPSIYSGYLSWSSL